MRTLLVVLTGWISSVGSGADCLQPVLVSVFPPELRVAGDGGARSVTLFGRDLGFDATWQTEGESSRCTSQVWVRKADQEDGWQVAVDGTDQEGSLVLRQRGRGWSRLEFSGAGWLGDAGKLEVMVVRGRTRMDGTFSEAGRSEVVGVSVVGSPAYELTIDRVLPTVVRPGSRGAVIRLEGRFTWDTEVMLNGERVTAAFIDPGAGVVEVGLGANLLAEECSHVFFLQNPDGARSKEAVILVTEPTLISKTSPSQLKSGRGGQTVKLRYEGATPEKVEISYQPASGIERAPETPTQEDFSDGFSTGQQDRSETVTATEVLIRWTEIDAQIRKNEVRFRVDANQIPGPGSLIVKLSGPTGESAAVFMVEDSNAAHAATPRYETGPPEKDHTYKTRDKF